jgi:hypothetical protein
MVEINRIEVGVARYLDAELVNKLPGNTWKQFGAGMMSGLIAKRGGIALGRLKAHPVAKAFSIVDEAGCIDVEILRELAREKIPDGGLPVDVPLIGKVTVYKEDVEKLYGYIVG